MAVSANSVTLGTSLMSLKATCDVGHRFAWQGPRPHSRALRLPSQCESHLELGAALLVTRLCSPCVSSNDTVRKHVAALSCLAWGLAVTPSRKMPRVAYGGFRRAREVLIGGAIVGCSRCSKRPSPYQASETPLRVARNI
jgi:hypothetical protein